MDTMVMFQFTPATPRPLPPEAPIVPATWVPWVSVPSVEFPSKTELFALKQSQPWMSST